MKFRHRKRVPVQKRSRTANSAGKYPVVNAGARPNPLRVDPTRTTTLRRQLGAELKRRFARLKLAVAKLIVQEDAFGMKPVAPSQLFANLEANHEEADDATTADTDTPTAERSDALSDNNCGTGGGGFKPGNTCGGGAGKGGGKVGGGGGGGAAAKEEEEKKEHQGLLAKLKRAGAAVGHLEHSVKEYIVDKVETNVAKMPPAVQNVLRATYHVARVSTQAAFASWTAGQALAERVAMKKGMSAEQAKTLRGVLTTMDIAAMKPIQIGLGAAGMKALALPASLIPPATAGYLTYSAARNPIATFRAAKELVGEGVSKLAQRLTQRRKAAETTPPATRFAKLDLVQLNAAYVMNAEMSVEEELRRLTANDPEANAELVANELERHDYSDWYVALFHAALEATQSVHDALNLAHILYEETPSDPVDYEQPTEDDIQAVFGVTLEELEALEEHEDDIAGNSLLVLMQAYKPVNLVSNQRWRFHAEADKVREFRRWLKGQIAENITGVTDEQLWHKYIQNVYRKGVGRAHDSVNRAQRGAARRTKEDLLRSTAFRPEMVDKVRLLATRAFTDLEGVTEAMSVAMARTLAEGLVRKDSPATVARNLFNNIEGIGVKRALAVAKTEIVRAHAEGQLDAMEDLGVDEVSTMVEWNTSGNPCPLCAPLEGVVLTIDEAHGLIPRHPHCNCAWEVAAVSDSEEHVTQKREIERAMRRSATAAGTGDTWEGRHRSIRSRRALNTEDELFAPLPEPLLNHLAPLIERMDAYFVQNNCGTGGGGFKPGNTCGAGGGGGGGGGKARAGGGGAAAKEEEKKKEDKKDEDEAKKAIQVSFGSGGAKELADKLFGKELTANDYAAIACAPPGSEVRIGRSGGALTVYGEKRNAAGEVEYSALRKISKGFLGFGGVQCRNEIFKLENAPKGSGTQLFAKQVETLAAAGVSKITTNAVGSAATAAKGEGNGYYTWPRLGYSGKLTSEHLNKIPTDVRAKMKGNDVRDLFDVPGGDKVWREHGHTISLTFDLKAGSRNRKALDGYKESKK